MSRRVALALAPWFVVVTAGTAHAAYTEAVSFSFQTDQISSKAPMNTAYLLLDDAEGMNPLCEAVPLAPSGGGSWSTTVTLPESSNVDMASEMLDALTSAQGYSANAAAFETGADMWDVLMSIKRD